MNKHWLMLSMPLLAFWPVWRWYALRIAASPDEIHCLAALFTALFVLSSGKHTGHSVDLRLPTLWTLAYAATYPFVPPLIRAFFAFMAIGSLMSSYCLGKRFHPGATGLLILSLPIVPSLQFYIGYPLRLVVANCTAPLLHLSGFSVTCEGTCLRWRDTLVAVDAPCSGINMLWAGYYLVFLLCCLYRFATRQTFIAISGAFFLILSGNVFRSAALFYSESGIIALPAWGHTGVGLVTFLFTAATIAYMVQKIRKKTVCRQKDCL